MIVEFRKLPKKAQKKIRDIQKLMTIAEDKLMCIIQVDYNSGLIRFESLHYESLFINLYTSTGTLTVENREEGERNNQYHWKNCPKKIARLIFNNPKEFIDGRN